MNSEVLQTLVGEAYGEGYIGMYAVACVIQNRAKQEHLSPREIVKHGFMGKNNKMAKKASHVKTRAILKLVTQLNNLELKDITKGATHFENVEAFGWPNYDRKRKMIVTCKIGHHTFFKER